MALIWLFRTHSLLLQCRRCISDTTSLAARLRTTAARSSPGGAVAMFTSTIGARIANRRWRHRRQPMASLRSSLDACPRTPRPTLLCEQLEFELQFNSWLRSVYSVILFTCTAKIFPVSFLFASVCNWIVSLQSMMAALLQGVSEKLDFFEDGRRPAASSILATKTSKVPSSQWSWVQLWLSASVWQTDGRTDSPIVANTALCTNCEHILC